MFEVDGWATKQDSHFFIDDPVSSLDDHNIFVTASTLFDLIEKHFQKRKIIVTTHHIGLYCTLKDWLLRGEKAQRYKDITRACILRNNAGVLTVEKDGKDVMLYHLKLVQTLMTARQANDLRAFHFAMLRQLLENVASFLGTTRFAYVLERAGITDTAMVANVINTSATRRCTTTRPTF